LKKHKALFDKGCSKQLDKRNPRQLNGDNLSSIKLEANRHFRNKMVEYVKLV
jgi:hypothetical protein